MSEKIEHIGVVKGKLGNKLLVLIEQQSACAGCHAKAACMAADKSEKVINATPLDDTIVLGDAVIVFVRKQLGMKAVFLIYVIPFILMLLSLIVLNEFTKDEIFMGLFSLFILVPYYLLLIAMRKSIDKEFQFFCRKHH